MIYFKLKAEMNFALINCLEMDSTSISLYKKGRHKACLVVFPSYYLWPFVEVTFISVTGNIKHVIDSY